MSPIVRCREGYSFTIGADAREALTLKMGCESPGGSALHGDPPEITLGIKDNRLVVYRGVSVVAQKAFRAKYGHGEQHDRCQRTSSHQGCRG